MLQPVNWAVIVSLLAGLQHVLWCREAKKQVAGKGRENSLLFLVRAGELLCCGIMFFQCYKTHLRLQQNGCNVLFPGVVGKVTSFWGNVTTGLPWEHIFGAHHRFLAHLYCNITVLVALRGLGSFCCPSHP